jgi:cytidylate kinase
MPRPDGPVVAIDGPAGAGKSSVARAVARRLGLLYLDTGGLYRSVGLAAMERGLDPHDAAAMSDLCGRIVVDVRAGDDGGNRFFVDGVEVTDRIRAPEVSRAASAVSAHRCVRDALLSLQRDKGARGGVVMDGRDVGTVVFPDADVKVFLTASDAERARRRHAELETRGEAADFDAVLAEQRARDARDRGRDVAPLVAAPDAIELDTSGMTLEQVIERVTELVGGV